MTNGQEHDVSSSNLSTHTIALGNSFHIYSPDVKKKADPNSTLVK